MSLASDSLESIGLAISFLTSLIFSFMYEFNSSFESGVIACVSWFTLATYFFLVFATYTSNAISILFMGIGAVYVIRLVVDAFARNDPIRQLTEDRL